MGSFVLIPALYEVTINNNEKKNYAKRYISFEEENNACFHKNIKIQKES